ncbi:MAG: DUF4430 domain-containing protein [Erysipelotrichaceae bacterium]|nr:DUF4430 domain-containing protein [Erysipelotrichaceae bacterium]
MNEWKKLLIVLSIVLTLIIAQPVTHVEAAKTYKVQYKIIGINKSLKSKVMAKGTIKVKKNKTVYYSLKKFCKQKKLTLKSRGYGPTRYVYKIGSLQERQHGNLSGWMYSVNGKYPNKSCGSYKITKKCTVVWTYVNATK